MGFYPIGAVQLFGDAYNLVQVGAPDEALKASLDILHKHLVENPPAAPEWTEVRQQCEDPSVFRERWKVSS